MNEPKPLSDIDIIILCLSRHIADCIKVCATERFSLLGDDRPNNWINDMQTKIVELRQIREKLEKIFWGDAGV